MDKRSRLRQTIFLLTGPYRLFWRPFSNTILLFRARIEALIWGMEAVTQLAWKVRGRQLPALLRGFGAHVEREVDLRDPMIIHNANNGFGNLTIGTQSHIGKNSLLDLAAPITIGEQVTIAMRVTLVTHFDTYYSPLRFKAYPSTTGAIVIENGAYVGAGAIILQNVRIGRCAVVGAGAVVREDVPPYSVVAGVPARIIKQIDPLTLHDDTPEQ